MRYSTDLNIGRARSARQHRCAGFSLIELLVAIAISGFLMLAMAGIMASSKKNYDVTDATVSIQENARFAMNSIARDLRMANFGGCALGGVATLGIEPVQGNPIAPIFANGESDEFTIRLSNSADAVLRSDGPMDAGETILTLDPNFPPIDTPEIDDQLLLSDCGHVEDVVITDDTNGPLQFTIGKESDPNAGLDQPFKDGATVTSLSTRRYFVDRREKDDGTLSDLPVLFVDDNGTVEEIASGVEFMRVLYGVDDYAGASDADDLPETYVSWEDYLANDGTIVSLQVGLLVRSVSDAIVKDGGEVSGNYASAEFDSTAFDVLDVDTAADLNLDTTGSTRQVFTNTFTIRNPIIE